MKMRFHLSLNAVTVPRPASPDMPLSYPSTDIEPRHDVAPVGVDDYQPLKKPVNALAVVAQSERITVLARKTYNVLLSLAQDELRKGAEVEVHRAPLEEVVHLLRYDSNDIAVVKKHLRSMVKTTVEWQSPTTGEGSRWTVCGLLSQCELEKVRNQVWVSWAFAPALRHELLNPRVFARMNLAMVSQLTTHAAVFLYELACRYQNVAKSPRQAWRWWHDPMTGRVPDPERLEKLDYSFFKRDVLKPAIAQVNANTDFTIELIEHKSGRFINEIQFNIKVKDQRQLGLQPAPEKADLESMRQAREMGITDARVEKIVDTYGSEALASALPELRRRVESTFPAPVRDPERYLMSLMPGHAQRAAANAVAREARKDPDSPESLEIQGRRRQAYETAWKERRLASIEADFRARPPESQQQTIRDLLAAMEAQDLHPQIIKRFKKDGWSHPLVKGRFLAMYAEATIGQGWNVPTDEDLLAVAAHLGDAGVI